MVQKVIPYLVNLDTGLRARGKATLINELTMGLIDLLEVYGSKVEKYGKIHHISMCFWPVRLIPLNKTRACVCSYLLNTKEELEVGKFKKKPPRPDNVIKGADPESFLKSLENYNDKYLDTGGFLSSSNFDRGDIVQEALFSADRVKYFENFFLNQYNISAFSGPYFVLEGDPIAKSVNQVSIAPEIVDFVNMKDVTMLDNYADTISDLCDTWIKKGKTEAEKLGKVKIDTREEEKQLAMLNEELQKEKERDLDTDPQDLVKSGKFKINDKTDDLNNHLGNLRNSVGNLKEAINKRDLFLLDEAMKDLNLHYDNLGNSIRRYEKEISQLKRNIDREISDIESAHQQKISELESKIAEVEQKIEDKHSELSNKRTSTEDVVSQIKNEKQAILTKIEEIKDDEMTHVQEFLNNYTIEIKTEDTTVGIPIFIFYFTDPQTKKTNVRVPVLPIMVEGGSVVSTKAKEAFREKLEKLMNKYNPLINLVEKESEKSNLMTEIKNLDTQLEEAINDLRINKVLKKRTASKAKDIITSLIW
jgi:hypothetical protein